MTGLQTNLLQWLGRIEHWQWTQSYDDGFRYGQITNNLVEAVNFVLRRTCHLPIFVVFLATFNRLAILGPKIRLRQVKQTEIGYVHVEAIRKAMAVNARRAQTMNAKLYSCDFESFQVQEYIGHHPSFTSARSSSIRYLSAHVHVACVTSNLNAKQFIDDTYTLQCTLRIWRNEFLVMSNISNWEVPLPVFEMLPDRSLRRHLKGQPHMTRIRGDMDVRETSEPKHCRVC
ncbi:hypothetical protein GOBAR_AA23418 [Gossypium barbadense]|uniref:Uncharacterized protein n=1 Tax=Gossypium barbadense TaxID=3634 RepID=A0A2P5X1N0_GOSBA|nr:hypothetical protein GOBAR_AA23418 [Gossypium barbadense]